MVAKPQMRGFLVSKFKRDMVYTTILSVIAVLGFKAAVVDPRRQKYADFYKNYDIDQEFQRMNAAGLFQSTQD